MGTPASCTPPAIINKLSQDMGRTLKDPATVQRLQAGIKAE